MAAQLFGLIIPGRAVRTDFVLADPSGLKYTLSMSEGNPTIVSDIVFFLLPGAQLPPGHGAVLYWQISGATTATGFEALGAIIPDRPSVVLRTGWAQNESILSAIQTANGVGIPVVTVTLGVSIEPLGTIGNMGIATKGVEDRLDVAKKIATDLFNYLTSFDMGSFPSNGGMTVPKNAFDRWIRRFEAKYRVDPNFFMKDS